MRWWSDYLKINKTLTIDSEDETTTNIDYHCFSRAETLPRHRLVVVLGSVAHMDILCMGGLNRIVLRRFRLHVNEGR